MTNYPNPNEEPLKNEVLEAAMLRLQMALTPEESIPLRRQLLEILRDSHVAVPTSNKVPTAPDGTIPPGSDISLILLNNDEGATLVPTFTTLGLLRVSLPQLEHGVFLTGAQIGGILGNSPHKLLLIGPDRKMEIEIGELREMLETAQLAAQAQQESVQHNKELAAALMQLWELDTEAHRDQTVQAFLTGFCRLPIAGENDADAPQVVLNMNDPNNPEAHQEIPLLLTEDLLPAFTSEMSLERWNKTAKRNAIILPGHGIAQMAWQAQATPQLTLRGIVIDPGSAHSQILTFQDEKLIIG